MPLTPGRRAILASLLVGLPAAVLIGIGLFVAVRQDRATKDLTAINRRQAGERFALQFERGMSAEVERCFEREPPCATAGRFYTVFSGNGPEGPFADELHRRLAADLRFLPRKSLGHIQPLAYFSPPMQAFYSAVEDVSGGQKLQVLVLNLDFVAKTSLDSAAYITKVSAKLVPASAEGTGPGDAIHFPILFPFWQLEVEPVSTGTHPIQDLLVLSVMIAGAGLLLLGSIAMFTRNQWRQWTLARERTRFVSGVSHDLRMPLANIRVYADLLRTIRGEGERQRYCDIICQQSDSLARQFDEMLEFAQIESGRRRYALAPADLREPVQDAIAQSGAAIRQRGFHLACDLPTEPVLIEIDRPAVTEAVYNLLENAIKYSDSSRDLRLWMERGGSEAIVGVRDDGPGIPKKLQPRIFEPFYRGPQTAQLGGFGLGLFLVRQTMRAHRGDVELTSEPGRGSTFRLRFPLSRTHLS